MTQSAARAVIPAFFIVLAPVREGDLDPDLASRLSEYAKNSVLVLVQWEETAVQAAEQGLRTMTVPFKALEGSFVSQVRTCAGLLVDSGVLALDSQAVFLSQKTVKMGLDAFKLNCGALAAQAEPSLFICRTPARVHPLRLKTGFVLIDLDLQVHVLTGRSTYFGSSVPSGQLQTNDFPLSWSSYGIHRHSGYAGMVRASHQGTSFVLEDHVKRSPANFATPILLHYEIRGSNTARRYVAAEEVSSQAGTLNFVPAYQKVDGASMLFVQLEDGSTAVFVDATLTDFNLVLLLYPDVTAEFCEDSHSLSIPSVAMKNLERVSHMSQEYVGPFRLRISPLWESFLAVLLAHNSSGDVDILHHIPMQSSRWAYDRTTDEVLVKGKRKIYGRQALPDIYSPVIATGTAIHLRTLSTDDAYMFPINIPDHMDSDAVPFVPCAKNANATGFLSTVRKRAVEILEMETQITPITPEAIENCNSFFELTRENLCRHKMIIAVKDKLLKQFVSEVAEMPLAKVLDVHSQYVNQTWPLVFEMLSKRLPALNHTLTAKFAPKLPPRVFSSHRRFGAGIVKRPLDVMPSVDGKSIWVTDCEAACVWHFDHQGRVMEKIENGLKSPRYFIADNGMSHISDPFAQKIFTLVPSGKMIPFHYPLQLKFQGEQFWPIAGCRVGDQYLFRAMNLERNVGVFLCDMNGANANVLVHAQPSIYCLDAFDADEHKMVLTSSNERTLYVYTFSTKEWRNLLLPLKIPNITGLSLVGDCVLIKTPPQVICYNFVKCKMLFNVYIPDLIGHRKWPFNAFRASTSDGQTILYIATIDNDIAVIDLGKLNYHLA